MNMDTKRNILAKFGLALKSDLDEKVEALDKICDGQIQLMKKNRETVKLVNKYENIIVSFIQNHHLIMQDTNGSRYVTIPHDEFKNAEGHEIEIKCDLYNSVIVKVKKGE